MRERSSRVAELEQELEVVEGELSAAQEAASHAPSRSMRNLVEKLRGQLAIKEKQHKVCVCVCVCVYVCVCVVSFITCFSSISEYLWLRVHMQYIDEKYYCMTKTVLLLLCPLVVRRQTVVSNTPQTTVAIAHNIRDLFGQYVFT